MPNPSNYPTRAAAGSCAPRNAILDATKGLGILLVVLCHTLQSHLAKPDDSYLYRFIFSFQMPLFFLLSGWTLKPDTRGRIGKTLLRLLPATFCWYMIQYVTEERYKTAGLASYLVEFLKNPDTGLWFLWVLAFCIVVLVLCRRLETRLGATAYLLGAVVLVLLPTRCLGLPLVRHYFPYLVIGYLVSRSRPNVAPVGPYVVCAATLIYLLLMPLWQRAYTPTNLSGAYVLAGHPVPVGELWYAAVKFIEGLLGTVIATALAFLLYARFHVTALLWFGRNTLEIYVSHQFFIYLFPSPSALAIFGTFVLALSASIALALVLKTVPSFSFLLYGGSWKPPIFFSHAKVALGS